MIKHYINEILYQTMEAQYSASFHDIEKGFTLRVDGYNEKIDQVYDLLMKNATKLPDELDETSFQSFVHNLKKSYSNSVLRQSSLAK